MQIVIAWLEEDHILVKLGRTDLGERHTFKTVPKGVACMWLNNGTDADLAKAESYAKQQDGRTVFCYENEKDPLSKARKDILLSLSRS